MSATRTNHRPSRVPAAARNEADAGFTLMEVVLAMFLLLLGSTALLGLLSFGAGSARTAVLRAQANASLPAVVAELEETLFPLVVDEVGFEYAGAPVPKRTGLPVPGYPQLSYDYECFPMPTEEEAEAGVDALEFVVEIAIAWREGGQRRAIEHTTILLREVPFGERLRQRFVQRLEPLTEDEHLELIRSALEREADEDDPNGRRPDDPQRAQAARAED